MMAELVLSPGNLDHYKLFLKVKALPRYSVEGRVVSFPDEYLSSLGLGSGGVGSGDFRPEPFLFDYQRDISSLAVRKRKFATFVSCGLGKTLIMMSYARHVASELPNGKCVLIVSPPNVIPQTIDETRRFFGDDIPIEQVKARNLGKWLESGAGRVGITNYEAITDRVHAGRLGSLILDESSMLKSAYGKWGQRLIEMGRGLDWKLCLTGTPAPNDRIEYGSHAVFLDQFPTVNAFLARYFVNRGKTDNRWELKPHALRPFYRSLSHWSIFLENPATYGWKDNAGTIPPIQIHIHDVPLTAQQRAMVSKVSGDLYGSPGGIVSRSKLAQLAKGRVNGKNVETNKPGFIRDLIATWKGEESTLLWCLFNREQDDMEAVMPEAGSICGSTPLAQRLKAIRDFQTGSITELISKPEVLGFGLNLQKATRQVFNGLKDCYDQSTEILTNAGWKSFGEVAVGERVATVNPGTLNFEWQACERVIWEPYSGPMCRFQGQRNFDLLVTPNHKLFVQRCPLRYSTAPGKWELVRADSIMDRFRKQEYRMLSAPLSFHGDNPESVAIPTHGSRAGWSNSRHIPSVTIKDFVALAGWYVTEGYCRPHDSPEFGRIVISQTDYNPECRQEIIELFSRVGLSANTRTKDITGYSRSLAKFLMGEFGSLSANKRLPCWVKGLSVPLLTILRDVMLDGDGCHQDGVPWTYRTISRRLADDFQEVCLKTGIRGSVHPRMVSGQIVYDVSIAKKNIRPTIYKAPELVEYTGMIGCVTVPNHVVIVRRNGIPVVSGNSYEKFHQAVKRSNRVGSTRPLNVHIPVTDIEHAMVETVLKKAKRVQADIEEQEAIFKGERVDG